MGLTELTVNSCFFALSSLNFSIFRFFLVCLHIYLFRLCIKKDSEKGVTFKKILTFAKPDTHSAHAELKLPLLLINQLFHIKKYYLCT